ncbi:hypothetical protein [Acidovorax sp. A1169]|uniref:hypothetical protein n=1 Tax=Acidovorax sp. A1169 TaxID=3059524 RepID=UPI002737E522|nr:hypothetical protein [Acidovorax sp. A1169]MDP4073479.1 hypothetical protein [Acidovorax sp. A1169]
MTSHTKTLTALALVSVLLTACGGGGGGGGSGSFSSTSSSEVALAADPDPSTEPGVLTVTDATIPSLNGVYGSGQLTLTEVYYQQAMGVKPAVCAYQFKGADKVDASASAATGTTGTATVGTTSTPVSIVATSTTQAAVVGSITAPVSLTDAAPAVPTAFGKITYRPSATGLYFAFLTFNGKEYASGDSVDTLVDRSGNLVRFTSKTMTATDGSTDTLKLTAIIPLHATRNAHC